MNLIKYRNLFFAVSLIIIIPGIFALFSYGLKLGIDFSGGTLWEIKFENHVQKDEIQKTLTDSGGQVAAISQTSENAVLVRMRESDEEKIAAMRAALNAKYKNTQDLRLETVGPAISKELTQKAITAVAISILAIMLYITWAFRKVPKPTSSVAFGVTTIFALVHDVIVVVGIFAILGHFANIEIDSLFITALLTVIGFSVHDTIVVFDRIRENLKKYENHKFEDVVNHSLLQTLGRSLNTSLTAIFVLFALFLFGGESIKNFVLALLIGIISGTYSSIFNAAPLLVVWHNIQKKIRR